MNGDFLSIKDAAERTSKSPDSIRRMIKALLLEDADTPHIRREELRNGSTKYYISTEYLADYLAPSQKIHTAHKLDANSAPPMQEQTTNPDVISALIQQLTEKDHQIDELNERLREAHVLAASDPQRLLLLEGSQTTEPAPDQQPKRRRFFWQRRDRHVTP